MAVNRNKVLEAARKYLARGQYDKAIAQYQKLVDDDPRDVRSLLKIGDMQTRKGDRSEAAKTYQRVADHYASRGFFLKAVAVYKQILKLDPSRLDIQVRLGEMYEQLQLISDAMTTYEDVANSCMRAGETDRGLSMLAKMVDLDGEHIPVRIKYAEALSRAGRSDAAADEFERGASLLRAQGRVDDYIKVSERLLYHREEDVNLARELAQTYLERNDPKRALAKLQVCFKANPRDVTTLDLLARAFGQLGQKDKTISVYREIARIHREADQPDARIAALQKVLELDPSDDDARRALETTVGHVPQRPRRQSAVPQSAVVRSQPPPATGDDSGIIYLDEDDDIAIESIPPSGVESIPSGFEDTAVSMDPALELPLSPPTPEQTDVGAPPALTRMLAHLAPITVEQFEALPLASTGTDDYVSPQPTELERALETADHFLRTGQVDRAAHAMLEMRRAQPEHPIVAERLAEIEALRMTTAGVAPAPHAPSAPAPEYPMAAPQNVTDVGDDQDQAFAFAEKLAEDLAEDIAESAEFDDGGDVLDVEAVFQQFKKGVEEQVAHDDSDTHFDLGIAYKEMGLIEDARREFQVAMSSPGRQCLCWTMIGLCYMEEGRATDAIEAFQSGLDVEHKTESEELGLLFELGVACEAAGRVEDAIKHLERVYARDPQFRQVSKRLSALQAAGRPRKPRALDNIDDLDKAFDDLIKSD